MASDRPDLTIYCREREFAYAIIVVLTITAVPPHRPWIWFLGGGYLVFAPCPRCEKTFSNKTIFY